MTFIPGNAEDAAVEEDGAGFNEAEGRNGKVDEGNVELR